MNVLDGQVSKNFNLKEMKCPCCNGVVINERVLKFYDMLQKFRNWYSRPINVNSSYRCSKHNKKVGGASNSYHLNGLAVDFNLPFEFRVSGKERKEEFMANVINKWAELGGTSVVIYDTFIHLDYGNRQLPKSHIDIHLIDYRKNKNYMIRR